MSRLTLAHIPSSHLDLFWLGSYRTCLERGAELIKEYLDRLEANLDETFLLETVVFAEYFVQRYPEYAAKLRTLVDQGRVEIGTAYIDRWEHLILGESHIRNIQIGQRWSQQFLGRTNVLSTHPDLPGLVAQTSQVYDQAGVKYYVTSRKLYEDGAVWRHQAPDGSTLTFLNWPRHYIYYPINVDDLPRKFEWLRDGLHLEDSVHMFPLGTIPIASGAGDLTDPDDFAERYGAPLRDLIVANRERYPDIDFVFATTQPILEAYDGEETVPTLAGDIPSVWGVACDEEVAFFRRNRESEYKLLAAETLDVFTRQLGLSAIPDRDESAPWQGRYYESAFYMRNDPIASGSELDELWKMHVFTEDHNGGGYEGALGTFQKRVMQERVLQYTSEILNQGLDRIGTNLQDARSGLLAFNPLGQAWSGSLTFDIPQEQWDAGLRPVDDHGQSIPVQHMMDTPAGARVIATLPRIPSVGYRYFPLEITQINPAPSIPAQAAEQAINVETDAWTLTVDTLSGAITSLKDRRRNIEWAAEHLGAIRAIRESGNDVTLRIAPDASQALTTFINARVVVEGPLFTAVRLEKRLLDNHVEQVISLWHDGRVVIDNVIKWSGDRDWQLRLGLPTSATAKDVAYGTPFYGSGWTDITEEAYPRNGDEILVEDYPKYREAQEWLHVKQENGGLAIVTTHPGFVFDDRGLEAVLMRTSASCGDGRYFWENAGYQGYRFIFHPTEGDWQAAGVPALAQHDLRAPIVRPIVAHQAGALPDAQALLSVEPGNVLLSSLSHNVATGALDVRVFESSGSPTIATFQGPLADGLNPVNLLGEDAGSSDLPAWRIQTFSS